MNPLAIFLILFVGIPLIELYFLIQVGSEIGAFSTIFLTIFTALLGGWMVRAQGFSTLMRVREHMDRGQAPAFELMEGAVLLVCGFLLLLPGFITDTVGFLFLIPPLRRAMLLAALRNTGVMKPGQGPQSNESSGPRVIEGEFKREHDD